MPVTYCFVAHQCIVGADGKTMHTAMALTATPSVSLLQLALQTRMADPLLNAAMRFAASTPMSIPSPPSLHFFFVLF